MNVSQLSVKVPLHTCDPPTPSPSDQDIIHNQLFHIKSQLLQLFYCEAPELFWTSISSRDRMTVTFSKVFFCNQNLFEVCGHSAVFIIFNFISPLQLRIFTCRRSIFFSCLDEKQLFLSLFFLLRIIHVKSCGLSGSLQKVLQSQSSTRSWEHSSKICRVLNSRRLDSASVQLVSKPCLVPPTCSDNLLLIQLFLSFKHNILHLQLFLLKCYCHCSFCTSVASQQNVSMNAYTCRGSEPPEGM